MHSKSKWDFIEKLGSPIIWTISTSSFILLIVVLIFSLDNLNKGKKFINNILMEKGMAIIKAFESGTRAGLLQMGWEQFHIQKMISAIGKEKGILYIFICDEKGKALAHMDPNLIGEQVISRSELIKISPQLEGKFRIIEKNNKKVFEIYKIFRPIRRPRPFSRNFKQRPLCIPYGMGPRHIKPQDMWCNPETLPRKKVYIFIGLDLTHYEAARKSHIRNTILFSISLLITGIGGVFLSSLLFLYKKTKGQLSYTSALTDTIVSNLPAGLMVLDSNRKIIYINREFKKLIGTQVKNSGKKLVDEFSKELALVLDRFETDNSMKEIEINLTSFEQRNIPVAVSCNKIFNEQGQCVGSILIIRDLREIKKLQEEIQRKEKLASLGRLAAGMAHEIRNPLSSIKGMAIYFLQRFSEKSEEGKIGNILVEEVDRLNRVISELLEFAKPVKLQLEKTRLKDVIEHSTRLILEDAKEKHIKIEYKIDPEDLTITLDKDKFIQCILNILINSLEAMDEGGTLKIFANIVDGKKVLIEINDTGHGIDEKDLKRIFDPYYTTKKTGTGLGLAIVHRIIESHNGRIEVKSTKGKGTTFFISLPYK